MCDLSTRLCSVLGQTAWGLKQTEIEEESRRAKSTPHVQLHAGMQGGGGCWGGTAFRNSSFSLTLYSWAEKKKSQQIQGILKWPTKALTLFYRSGQHGWWIFFKNKAHRPTDVNNSFLATWWGHPPISEILHSEMYYIYIRAKEYDGSESMRTDLQYIYGVLAVEIVSCFSSVMMLFLCSSLLPSGCRLVAWLLSDLQQMLSKNL